MNLYEYLGVTKESLVRLAEQKARMYVTYKIKKHSGKYRRIDAPQEPLKSMQRLLVYKVLYLFRPHTLAYGFVRNRNPIDNANKHIGKKHIITIDIKDFFPSISQSSVKATLDWILKRQRTFTYTDAELNLLTELFTYNECLPQGAPTSPPVSNLVCIYLDKWLNNLQCSDFYKNRITITRYCDDITVSTDETKDLSNILRSVMLGLDQAGFKANKRKVKVRSYYQRMEVTGIVVNKKTNMRKTSWKKLRAALHNVKCGKQVATPLDLMKLRGQIEWLKSLNHNRGTKLLTQLSLITAKPSTSNFKHFSSAK